MKTKLIYLCGFITILLIIGCTIRKKADLIIINGNIYTVDEEFSKCSAIAVKNGIIMAVGSDEDILDKHKSSNIVDLNGAAMYPGFNDAHGHIYSLGIGLKRVDLRGASSFEQILDRLKERYDNEKPAYLSGDGWDQNLWPEKEFPDNKELSSMFPDIPVVLSRIDFHAVIVNDKAIEMLGISPDDPAIPTGEAITENGRFTGVFMESTGDRFYGILPEYDRRFARDVLASAQQECFRYGLTSVSSAGESLAVVEAIDSMYNDGSLKLRLDVWLTPSEENLSRFTKPSANGKMRIGTIKLYIDGALGSRGALMLEPYSDRPDTKGLRVITDTEFERICKWAYESGFQVATHCIGDSANRSALISYSKFLEKGNDRRWRIEHAQIVNGNDFSTFGEYQIVPSIQPTHATSDMFWAADRVGARINTAYAYRQLLGQLGWIPSGTDFPIESVNPVYTFFAAVCRKSLDFAPAQGFQMGNALSKEDALRSMTIWAAKSSFEENEKGSIEPGKYADFVVLDTDIMEADEASLPKTKVLMTFLGGEMVYSLLP